jgi:hypothetical protein
MFWRAIKPKKLKDKQIQRKIRNAVLRVGRGILRDYKLCTQTWSHQPVFEFTRDLSHQPISFLVGTDDEIFRFIDKGTGTGREDDPGGSYTIEPVNKKALSFQPDFFPKTFPGRLGSRTGGKSGEPIARFSVEHPGIEAREFTTLITKKWRPRFIKAMEEAIKSGIRESGHAR